MTQVRSRAMLASVGMNTYACERNVANRFQSLEAT